MTVMASVVHVFLEASEDLQQQHLHFWFGYPEVRVNAVCRCGAELVPLGAGSDAFAVWHRRSFRRRDAE